MAERPTIGIIGKGNVGSHLKNGLESAGYSVHVCGHDPEHVAETAKEAEILILAVPNDQLHNAVKECGGHHKGKILVDVSNVTDENGEFSGSLEQSTAEALQAAVEEARVVKAFNTTFAPTMDEGRVNGDRLSAFVAGDDPESREAIEALAADIGFEPVDAGPLKNARYLEAMGYLNMQLGERTGSDHAGFRLLHE